MIDGGYRQSGFCHAATLLLMCPAVLLAGACRDAPTDAQPRWLVSHDPVVEIGLATGDELYLFGSIRSAHLRSDGRIVVADAEQLEIRVYGSDGVIQSEFGGQGAGPGEFYDIEGMWITSEGNIAVFDPRNRRVTVFDQEGDLQSTSRVVGGEEREDPFANLNVFLGSFEDDDALLASLQFGTERGEVAIEHDRWILGRFGLDGTLVRRLGELRGMRRAGQRPLPFSSIPRVAVGRDSTYVAEGYSARIRVLDDAGAHVRAIELARQEVGRDDPWSALEARLRRMDDRFASVALANLRSERVPREDRFPQIAGLLMDDRGYLWVKTYEIPDDSIWLSETTALLPAPGGEWRVVRPNGEVVARVRIPESLVPLEITDSRILGLTRDDAGVERLVVHEVER